MFTVTEAYNRWADGDPIMIDHDFAEQICAEHGVAIAEFEYENEPVGDRVDAWDVLSWLGH